VAGQNYNCITRRSTGSLTLPVILAFGHKKMKMTTIQALSVIEEEIIESHSRCQYPYVLTSAPASIGSPPDVSAGVYVAINSDVFGRIAGSSQKTFAEALRATAKELLTTRDARWSSEIQAMKPRKQKADRTRKSTVRR